MLSRAVAHRVGWLRGSASFALQRLLPLVIGGVVLCASPGCVYYRFFKLKGQLSAFAEHFAVEDRERPTIIFRDPVLGTNDLTWLTGLSPSERVAERGGDLHRFLLRKNRAGRTAGREPDDLEVTFFYRDGLLAEISLPARFAAFLTEENFAEIFTPIREAEIRKASQKTRWAWKEMNIEMPTFESIREYLGPPTSQSDDPAKWTLLHKYDLLNHGEDGNAAADLRMRFDVWKYNRKLKESEVYCGDLWVYVDVSWGKGNENIVQVKRLRR